MMSAAWFRYRYGFVQPNRGRLAFLKEFLSPSIAHLSETKLYGVRYRKTAVLILISLVLYLMKMSGVIIIKLLSRIF